MPEILPASKRQVLKQIYDQINDVARPGDIAFYISQPEQLPNRLGLRNTYRRWQGFHPNDVSQWHTAIFVGPKKEKHSSLFRPHIIHAIDSGVEEVHILPSFFTSIRTPTGTVVQHSRLEIIQDPNVSHSQRLEIVKYAQAQLDKPFDYLGWRYLYPTYLFGLPTRRLDPHKVSCHGMAYLAYEKIGYKFPHQFDNMPKFNPAKSSGRPFFGHPVDSVNLHRLYLVDHHLYRDHRFHPIITVFDKPDSRKLIVATNPPKYSWLLNEVNSSP